MDLENTQCPSCGSERKGEFCSQCGEQRLNNKLRSLHYILSDIIQDLTSVDGKLWKTLRAILLKPGELEYHYYIGRRVEYLRPITLFFVLNVIFVMFSPLTDFYINLYDQITLQPYSAFIKGELNQYLNNNNIPYKEFEQNYNQLVIVLARSLIILQVPIYALASAILLANRQYYSGDYFNFSLNMHSWLLMWVFIAMIPAFVIGNVVYWINPSILPNKVYFLLLPVGLAVYLIFALRKMFQLSWIQCLWRLPLLLIAYQLCHTAFRLLQFLITASLVEVQ